MFYVNDNFSCAGLTLRTPNSAPSFQHTPAAGKIVGSQYLYLNEPCLKNSNEF